MMLATITDMLIGLGALCLLVANAITLLWVLRRFWLFLLRIEVHEAAMKDLYHDQTQLWTERLTFTQKLHTLVMKDVANRLADHTKPEAEPEPARERGLTP